MRLLLALLITLFTLPVFAENTILIIGDSMSAGYGFEPSQGWPALLQNRINENKFAYVVNNASVTGETTSGGLTTLPAQLKKYHPKITIIALGNNDGLRGLQISLIKDNLLQLVKLAQQANSKVLILGCQLPPNYGPDYTNQFHQIYLDLAKRHDISVVPQFLKGITLDPKLLQADGVHPTAAAQIILLNNIWHPMQKLMH